MSGYTAEQWTAAGFNAAYYKANNTDVTDIFGTTDDAVLAHYILHGNAEGRAFSADMKAWQDGNGYNVYLVINPDLLGSTEGEVYLHYKLGNAAETVATAQKAAATAERVANAAAVAAAVTAAQTAATSTQAERDANAAANTALAARVVVLETTGGPKGAPGASGAKGAPSTVPGAKGATGAPGAKGAKGEGVKGTKGAQGVGAKGAKGAAGNNGAAGNKGAPGQNGQNGSPGQKGQTGASGSGAKGAPGSPGQKGAPGVSNQPGAKGAKGEAGEASLLEHFLHDIETDTALIHNNLDLRTVSFSASGVLAGRNKQILPSLAGVHVLRNCNFNGNHSVKDLLSRGYTGSLDLTGSTFEGCNLGSDSVTAGTSAVIVNANVNLGGCSFKNAILSGVDFTAITAGASAPSNFEGAYLAKTYKSDNSTEKRTRTKLPSAPLDHANFKNATLHEVDLVDSANITLNYADFTGANMAEGPGYRQFDMNDITNTPASVIGMKMHNLHNDKHIPTGLGTSRFLTDIKDSSTGNDMSALVHKRANLRNVDFSGTGDATATDFGSEGAIAVRYPSSAAIACSTTPAYQGTIIITKLPIADANGQPISATGRLTVTFADNAAATFGVDQITNKTGASIANGTNLMILNSDLGDALSADGKFVVNGAIADDATNGASNTPSAGFAAGQDFIVSIDVGAANKPYFALATIGGANGGTGGLITLKGDARASTLAVVGDTLQSVIAASGAGKTALANAVQAQTNNGDGTSALSANPEVAATINTTTVAAGFFGGEGIEFPELEAGDYVNVGGVKFTANRRVSAARAVKPYADLTPAATSATKHAVAWGANTTGMGAVVTNADISRAAGISSENLKTLANAAGTVYTAGTWAAWKWRAMHVVQPADDATAMLADAADVLADCHPNTGKAIAVGEYIQITSPNGTELLKVTAKNAANTQLTVLRSQGGSTAVAHTGATTAIKTVVYKLPLNRQEDPTLRLPVPGNAAEAVKWEADYGDIYVPPMVQKEVWSNVDGAQTVTTAADGNNLRINSATATAIRFSTDGINTMKILHAKAYHTDGVKGELHSFSSATYPLGRKSISVFDKETVYATQFMVGHDMNLTKLSEVISTGTPADITNLTDAEKTHDLAILASLDNSNISGLFLDLDRVQSMNDANLSNATLETALTNLMYAERLNITGARFKVAGASKVLEENWYAKGIYGEPAIDIVYNAEINNLYELFTTQGAQGCMYGPGIDLNGCTIPAQVTTITANLQDASFVGVNPINHGVTITGSMKNVKFSSLADKTSIAKLVVNNSAVISGAVFDGLICQADGAGNKLDLSAAAANPSPAPSFEGALIKGCALYAASAAHFTAAVPRLGTAGDVGANVTRVAANFKNADLTDADLDKANFQGADFDGANLTNMLVVQACNMTGCSFAGATMTNFKAQTTRTGSTRVKATLTDCSFEGATITGIQIKDTDVAASARINFKNTVTTDNLSTLQNNINAEYSIRTDKASVLHILPNDTGSTQDLSNLTLSMDIGSQLTVGNSNLENFVLQNCTLSAPFVMAHASASAGAGQAGLLKGMNFKNVTLSGSGIVRFSDGGGAKHDAAEITRLFGSVAVDGTEAKALGFGSAISAANRNPSVTFGTGTANTAMNLLGKNIGALKQGTTELDNGSMFGGSYNVPTMNLNNLDIKALQVSGSDLANLSFNGAKYGADPTAGAATLSFTGCKLPTGYKEFIVASNGNNMNYVIGPGINIAYAADLDGAQFINKNLTGMKFGTDSVQVDFMTDATNSPAFTDSILTNVDFGNAKIATGGNVDFRGATLSGTDFGNVVRTTGKFEGIELTEDDAANATMPPTTDVAGRHNMSIIGTVDGKKKFKNVVVV